LIQERQHEVEYDVDTHEDRVFILTNENNCKNFFLKSVRLPTSDEKISSDSTPLTNCNQPEVLIEHQHEVMIHSFIPYQNFIVIKQRHNGLPRIQVIPLKEGYESHFIEFPEPSYSCSLLDNEFRSDLMRFRYSSPVTPRSVYEYHMSTRTKNLLKQDEVLGINFSDYIVERIDVTSHDGVQVPVSLVRKKSAPLDGSSKCYLQGYGAYGLNSDAGFSTMNYSLLDRDIIVATAHIRGGGEKGRYWYEDGKMLKKKNSFEDFLAAAKELSERKYTSPDRLAVSGGSAGGLLIGASLNLAGDSLFSVAVAAVPFMDVITTLLDEKMPLTAIEWEEWGNPKDKETYEYMKGYSPYDNIIAQRYPHTLITAGFNDSRVHYSEPAKFCAKLRELKTDSNVLMLKTLFGSGHLGSSGRYASWKETAFEFAFVINQLQKE